MKLAEWDKKIEYKKLQIKHESMIGKYWFLTITTLALIISVTIIIGKVIGQ